MGATPEVLVDLGDIHCGHRLGPTPERGFVIDGGNLILPNGVQKAINEAWARYQQMVRDVTKGRSYTLIFKGEAIEGDHHRAKDALSINIVDQTDNAYEMLKDIFHGAAEVYWARGTPAHSGPDGEWEEALAQRLGAIPVKNETTGQESYTRQIILYEFGEYLVQAAHHIGGTGSPVSRGTALAKEITNLRETAGAFGLRPPDLVTRGHCHMGRMYGDITRHGMGISLSTPGWMGKNGHCYRGVGPRTSQFVVGAGIHEISAGRLLPWVQGYPLMPELPELEVR